MQLGEQVGPFVIEKVLGGGAMGTVFRARHAQTGQRVAVKVVAPALAANPQSMERFKRESAILKQLRHPNVVRLIAVGRHHGTPFYAMEYAEGESLDRVLARRGRITWEELVTLGQQLASALQHVHERGIIHRDLKPSNVMVLRDGTPKLTDFGIAKDVDVTALTAANNTVGTASYMSPEQCRGVRDLTFKSDLYSLGVMFFELLTGRKPFQADSPLDMFTLHLKAQPPRPGRLVLDIPIWLDTLIMQLLEKEPDQRPYSAAAVGEALTRVREKALAQQSAGVDLVKGRTGEHKPAGGRLEESDKEAARLLLGRKKKKQRARPFYQHGWFQGAAAATLLAVIGYVFWATFLKTPSPETLYQRASDLMASPDTFLEAREGPIADFLRYYPERSDRQAQQLRAWADRVDLETREEQMHKRRSSALAPEGDAEKHARLALDAEEAGDLPAALKEWQAVEPLRKESDAERRPWGLVAQKYRLDIDRALELWKKVDHKVRTEPLLKKPYRGQDPLEETAVQAARAEANKKTGPALKLWRTLGRDAQGAGQRPWKLLAAWRLHELHEPNPEEAPGRPAARDGPTPVPTGGPS